MSCTHPFTQYDCDILFCSDCGERIIEPKTKTHTHAVCGYHGFGFGVWRSVMSLTETIWTVCIGPVSIYIVRH